MRFLTFCLLICSSFATPLLAESLTPPYSWRGINGQGVFPAKDLVTTFYDFPSDMVALDGLPGQPGSRKNIVWRTTLPHWGMNTPVVVGDKVFVLCDDGWKSDVPELLCLQVQDGAIVWQHGIDGLDGRPSAEAEAGKELRAKHLEYYRSYMRSWNEIFWDNDKNAPSSRSVEEAERVLAEVEKKSGWTFRGYRDRIERCKENKSQVTSKQGYKFWRGRCYWKGGNAEATKVHKEVVAKRYHWYPNWITEGPYYGNTMGSVVSDGKVVYAVTAHHAAAAFDLDGNRLWVTEFGPTKMVGSKDPGSFPGKGHGVIASPVLADGHLVYYHWNASKMYGLNTKTGKIAWQVSAIQDPKGKWGIRGNQGHMGPGGTPVVMKLDGQIVVISGHGLTVRVSDGALLGQVEHKGQYPCGYLSYAGKDDLFFWNNWKKVLYASRLGIDGDTLTQETAWQFAGECGSSSPPNFVVFDGLLHVKASQGKSGGKGALAIIDPQTGRSSRRGGGGGWSAFGLEHAVFKGGGKLKLKSDGMENKTSHPDKVPGFGVVGFSLAKLPELQAMSYGYLCPPAPTGEIAQRHIATIGTSRIVPGKAAVSCWGNRIFYRDNDYLWCIGDPDQVWVPPETHLP